MYSCVYICICMPCVIYTCVHLCMYISHCVHAYTSVFSGYLSGQIFINLLYFLKKSVYVCVLRRCREFLGSDNTRDVHLRAWKLCMFLIEVLCQSVSTCRFNEIYMYTYFLFSRQRMNSQRSTICGKVLCHRMF
jgi:hypothetical protein